MNTETGEVKRVLENEKLKQPWVGINEPNPSCRRCHGKGIIVYGNCAERRHTDCPMKFIPCPECQGEK